MHHATLKAKTLNSCPIMQQTHNKVQVPLATLLFCNKHFRGGHCFIQPASAAVAIPSSSTISSALTPAPKSPKVLPPPGTSSSATSTSVREETMTTPSTSRLNSTSTQIPSGTSRTGTISSAITSSAASSASSTSSLTSTTNQHDFVPSTPAVTSAQGSGKPSVHIVHSITVVTPTSTSTTTQFLESTFLTPVAVTTVQDGTTSVGTPALVTLLSTSTNSDGSSVTWTHVYANPPTVAAMRTKSFLHDTGAMAGIFALVGVIAAFFLLGMLYLIRRLYRRRRDNMLTRLQSSAPEHEPDYRNPFNDNGTEPVMHSLSYDITVGVSGSARPAHNASPSYKMAFFDVHGHATSTDQLNSVQQMQTNTSGTDLAQITPQSTPSIYPATLPLNDESDNEAVIDRQPTEQSKIHTEVSDALTERTTERNTVIDPVVLRERSRTADATPPPPRPPRSVLRTQSARVDSQYVSWVKSWSSTSSADSGSHPTT
ncbi:hypothetical protein APHAL10511_006400 [Amanita phalloides]|nr:hypothetical protein APHAL10511_006400 [Amanita phalloides]